MKNISRRAFGILGAAALAATMNAAPLRAEEALKSLEILAPSSAGSGYDQLARAIQQVLQGKGIVPAVEVVNVPGGGGTVGLAQFVTTKPRKPVAMVVGFALIGGVLTTQSAVTLDQTLPVGRLMGEPEVIVVPAGSDIKTLADLVARLKAAPADVSWAGGSIGGIDHVTAGLFSKAAGIDPAQINYVVHAGGGEVLASVLGGHATLGISGYEEFRAQVEAGKLVVLGVSGDSRIAGLEAPTFKEGGVDLSIMNWRGIVTHPDMSEADRAGLEAAIAELETSPEWAEALASKNWLNTWQGGADFGAFLKDETGRIAEALKQAGVIQ